jgi:predicted DsbA family dithiol-disulfide isomerase
MTTLTLHLYSDFVCPYCFIAEQSSLTRLQNEYVIEIDWRGFELHPETPLGGRPIAERVPPERLPQLKRSLHEFAASFGVIDFELPEHMPNTRRALAVAEYARELGKLETFRSAAMNAHWREGKNLEDEGDLREIVLSAGLAPEAALQAMGAKRYLQRVDAIRAEATQIGVTGIPTFVFGRYGVVGCQPYDVVAQAAEQAGARRRT